MYYIIYFLKKLGIYFLKKLGPNNPSNSTQFVYMKYMILVNRKYMISKYQIGD